MWGNNNEIKSFEVAKRNSIEQLSNESCLGEKWL